MRTDRLLILIKGVLAVFWVGSAIVYLISLTQATEQLGLGGFSLAAARATVQTGAVISAILGLMVCFRRTAPLALKGMVLMSLVYVAGGALWRRDLWFDPLGPLLKMLPVGALALAALAMTPKDQA